MQRKLKMFWDMKGLGHAGYNTPLKGKRYPIHILQWDRQCTTDKTYTCEVVDGALTKTNGQTDKQTNSSTYSGAVMPFPARPQIPSPPVPKSPPLFSDLTGVKQRHAYSLGIVICSRDITFPLKKERDHWHLARFLLVVVRLLAMPSEVCKIAARKSLGV